MRNLIIVFILSILPFRIYSQKNVIDFKTIKINKKVSDFPDSFNLSSPLKSFITYKYILYNGKDRLIRSVSTVINGAFCPDSTAPDSNVDENRKKEILETNIVEILYYKDSIAYVISEVRESRFSVRPFYLINQKWLQRGEDMRNSLQESEQQFKDFAKNDLLELQRINMLSKIPTDTAVFTNYIKNNGCDPKNFLISKLSKFKLVMYGEIHRRKASWDFLQNTAKDPRFAEHVGVIFMEMASHKQKEIDMFFAKDSLDKELLMNVFREYQIGGWIDKGMFDFLVCIWRINKSLPIDEKIKIVAADTPRPFSTFKTREDMDRSDSQYDRNEFMAKTVINYFKSKTDKRNALFIVGTAHIQKTFNSAGDILEKNMAKDIYRIFQHSPQVTEYSSKYERIRHGIFDYAFYKSGDLPIAFDLENSPFGKEPFDGIGFSNSGTFQDNYDGYVFFGSLDKEPNGELLLDMYSDDFVLEMDRRYQLLGTNLKDAWGLKELSRKGVLDKVLEDHAKTRWENMIKPLKIGN